MKPLKAKRPATSQQGAPVQLSLFDVLLQVAPELVPAVRAVNQFVSPQIQRFTLQQEPAPTGEIGRIRANLAAIALCKSLTANQEQPTPEQCNELARFSGWGSLAALWDEVTHKSYRRRRADRRAKPLVPEIQDSANGGRFVNDAFGAGTGRAEHLKRILYQH